MGIQINARHPGAVEIMSAVFARESHDPAVLRSAKLRRYVIDEVESLLAYVQERERRDG
jgi:hypothetical protein